MGKVEMTIDSIRQDLLTYEWVILLKDKSAERYLPIYVGQTQADTIKSLTNKKIIESGYSDLSVPGINLASVRMKSVIINYLKNNIFYAKLLLTHDDKSDKVDCPVAKAIALAIKEEVPIYALESLLDKASIDVSSHK